MNDERMKRLFGDKEKPSDKELYIASVKNLKGIFNGKNVIKR